VNLKIFNSYLEGDSLFFGEPDRFVGLIKKKESPALPKGGKVERG
jgi:hypothetical protein